MRERLEVLDGVVKVNLLPHHVRLGSHSRDHSVPSGDETPEIVIDEGNSM